MRVIELHPDYTDPTDAVRNLRFAPDGRLLAATLGEEQAAVGVCWWDVTADARARAFWVEGNDPLRPDPAVSPDLGLVAYPGIFRDVGRVVVVLDPWAAIPAPQFLHLDNEPDVSWGCVAFSPDGEHLLAGNSGPAYLTGLAAWPVERLLDPDNFLDPQPEFAWARDLGVPTCVAVAPSGRQHVVGTDAGNLWVANRKTGEAWPIDKTRRHPVRAVTFSPDGRRVLVRQAGAISVWELAGWKFVAELTRAGAVLGKWGERSRGGTRLTDAAYSPDGRTLAVSCEDGTVRLHDAGTLAERHRLAWGVGPLYSVAFSPDRLVAAAGAAGGQVVLWDTE